jgi:hypothetical protein
VADSKLAGKIGKNREKSKTVRVDCRARTVKNRQKSVQKIGKKICKNRFLRLP